MKGLILRLMMVNVKSFLEHLRTPAFGIESQASNDLTTIKVIGERNEARRTSYHGTWRGSSDKNNAFLRVTSASGPGRIFHPCPHCQYLNPASAEFMVIIKYIVDPEMEVAIKVIRTTIPLVDYKVYFQKVSCIQSSLV